MNNQGQPRLDRSDTFETGAEWSLHIIIYHLFVTWRYSPNRV